MDWKNVLQNNPLSFWYFYLQIPQHQHNNRQVPPAGVYSGIGLWQCPLPTLDQSATTKGFGHVCRLRFSIAGRMTDKTLQRKRFIEKWANSSEAFLDSIFKSEELEETKKGLEVPTSIGCEGRSDEGNSLKMWEMRRLLAGEKKIIQGETVYKGRLHLSLEKDITERNGTSAYWPIHLMAILPW